MKKIATNVITDYSEYLENKLFTQTIADNLIRDSWNTPKSGFEKSDNQKTKYDIFSGYKVTSNIPDGSGLNTNDIEINSILLEKKLFTQKDYMTVDAIKNSHILAILGRNYYYYCEHLNLNLNDIINGICYLTLCGNNNYVRVPDKKLAQIVLHTNRKICHTLICKLHQTLSEYFNIYIDPQTGYFKYNINKELILKDSLINCCIKYLYTKQVKLVNLKSKRALNKFKRRSEELEFVSLSKLLKRKELYYKEKYNPTLSRYYFKLLTFGITYWYSYLTEQYRIPNSLKNFRANAGTRADIIYGRIPIYLLCSLTNLDGSEILDRVRIICRSCKYVKMHNKSYEVLSLIDKNEEFNISRFYTSQNLIHRNSVRHKREYEKQQYNTSNYSIMFITNELGKVKLIDDIYRYKNIFLYIILKYFLYNKFPTNEFEEIKQLIETKSFVDKYDKPLSKDDQQKIINRIKDLLQLNIDCEDLTSINKFEQKEIIRSRNLFYNKKVHDFINKDKIYSLPKMVTRKERTYSFSNCKSRALYNRIDKKFDKPAVQDDFKCRDEYLLFGNPDLYDRLYEPTYIKKEDAGNEISNRKIISCRQAQKVSLESVKLKKPSACVYYLYQVIKQIHTRSQSEIGINLNEYNKILEHILTGFDTDDVLELKILIKNIKKYRLVDHFIKYKQVQPYIKYLLK